MSKNEVSLQHVVRRHGNQMFFFYDGALEAKDGLLTLPADRPEWIRRAWVSGYRLRPDFTPINDWSEMMAEIEKQTSGETADSAKSTEEKSVEDSSAGRQSKTGNGVRAGKPQSSTGSKPSGTRSARGRGANAVEEKAKE